MKILVTGGAGFIGSNLVDKLIEKGNNVFVIDNLSTGKKENLNPKCTFFNADLVDMSMDALDMIMKNTDYVFHVAAKARVQPSIAHPVEFNDHNVKTTLKLLDSAARAKTVKRFIFSSSSSVYGQGNTLPFIETMESMPISPYALQKLIGEQYCQLYSKIYGLDTTCLRYFNVYGNRQPVQGAYCTILGIFTRQHMAGEALTITNDGTQSRDFTIVSDVVDANVLAMECEEKLNGQCFNIGFGKSISINEIASYFGGEKKYIGNVLEPKETLADNFKARTILGWQPKVAISKEYVDGILNEEFAKIPLKYIMKNKIAILTAISGNRDRLSVPTIVHENADYFAFVDEPTEEQIGSWTQLKIFPFTNDERFQNRRKAKPYKIMPELFVPGYDFYFWVDATHDVVVNPNYIIDQYLKDSHVAVFKHNQRKCAYEEANEIIKLNYDHTVNVTSQMKEYQKLDFPFDFGLFELPVIVRRNCFETTNFNLMWWEQICKYSSRDQISFPFCLCKTGIKFSVLPGYANGINPKTNNIGYNDLIPQTRHHVG